MAVVDDRGRSGFDDVPPPTEDFGRQPPQDEAAEQAVLGSMLELGRVAPDGAVDLNPVIA